MPTGNFLPRKKKKGERSAIQIIIIKSVNSNRTEHHIIAIQLCFIGEKYIIGEKMRLELAVQ